MGRSLSGEGVAETEEQQSDQAGRGQAVPGQVRTGSVQAVLPVRRTVFIRSERLRSDSQSRQEKQEKHLFAFNTQEKGVRGGQVFIGSHLQIIGEI